MKNNTHLVGRGLWLGAGGALDGTPALPPALGGPGARAAQGVPSLLPGRSPPCLHRWPLPGGRAPGNQMADVAVVMCPVGGNCNGWFG